MGETSFSCHYHFTVTSCCCRLTGCHAISTFPNTKLSYHMPCTLASAWGDRLLPSPGANFLASLGICNLEDVSLPSPIAQRGLCTTAQYLVNENSSFTADNGLAVLPRPASLYVPVKYSFSDTPSGHRQPRPALDSTVKMPVMPRWQGPPGILWLGVPPYSLASPLGIKF